VKKFKKTKATLILLLIFLFQAGPVYATTSTFIDSTNTVVEIQEWNLFGQSFQMEDILEFINGKMTPVIEGITLVLAAAMALVFLLKAFDLSKSGNNPNARQNAIQGMIYSLIACALLGSVSGFIEVFKALL